MTSSNRPLFTDETGRRDAAWVQAVLAGDAEAFGRLVEVWQRPALSTSYRLLGNSDDAMEVVQDALLKAYQSLSRLNEPSRFGPWLLRIVSNLSLNKRRSRKTSSTVTLDEHLGTEGVAEGTDAAAATGMTPERRVEGRELGEALDAAMAKLPDKQRLALVLFTIEEWPQKEIAELMGCSLENVKWYVFQGRKKLRELLGE